MNQTMDADKQQKLAAIRKGEILTERSCGYWSDKEREKLLHMFWSGIGISEIAMEFQRTESAVIKQLMDREVLTYPQNRRKRSPKGKTCSCPGHCELGCPYYREGGCYRVGAV